MSEVTEIIKRLRARGLSGSEIARRTQIHQSKISRWESGAVASGADAVVRLLAFERGLIDGTVVIAPQAHASAAQAATQTEAAGAEATP